MIFQARAILFLARHVKFLDGNGELVDWHPETGDGGPVDEFLQPSVEQRQLALDEALNNYWYRRGRPRFSNGCVTHRRTIRQHATYISGLETHEAEF